MMPSHRQNSVFVSHSTQCKREERETVELAKMQSARAQRIGLMGGTFDPIHNGHLIMAEEVRVELDLDMVLFIPAGQPPHKLQKPGYSTTAAYHRMAMVQLAI